MTANGFKMGGNSNMTCLQGYITTTYADLVGCFGNPTCDGDGYKVDAEWIITFDDGVVATIYNYKDGPNYCGQHGTPVENITDWHIGGRDDTAKSNVEAVMDAYLCRVCYQGA